MTSHLPRLKAVVAASLILMAPLALAPASAAVPTTKGGIQWVAASSDAEVDKAFAMAKQSGKPVFLYWGAVWCPPCNQVKATLFSRADFVERSRAFIPVYVDGDKPGAQKVASRFKVSGYPTMILFRPDGSEVTRLPGEVDPERYLLTLAGGMNAQVPVKDLVQRGLSRQPLTPEQWRLLAYYSWDTDEQQVLKTSELAKSLSDLSAAAPADLGQVKDRLMMKAIAARAKASNVDKAVVDADRAFIQRVLANADEARALGELLIYYAGPAVKYAETAPEARAALATKWDAALARMLEAGTLSRGDQMDAWDSRVEMWKHIDRTEKLSRERQQVVAKEVAKVVTQTTDKFERQAVVPSAAGVLTAAGLFEESDAMLKAELSRAVAPYYHMLGLASNAKKRGDKAVALQWYEQAWKKSEGPATRIQWGSTYVREIADLAPNDVARMSSAVSSIFSGLEPKGETFFERNQRSLQRIAKKLGDWQGSDPTRQQVVAKAKAQLAQTCSKVPAKDAGRANCEAVFNGGAAAS